MCTLVTVPALAHEAAFEADVLRALDLRDVDRALVLVMRELGAPVYRYCRRLLGDPSLADDVHQTVFTLAYEHFRRFERRSSLRSWIFAIAHNRCLDAIKVQRRCERRFTAGDAGPEPASSEPPVDERLGAAALRGAVVDCLQRLAPHIRMVVVLRYQEGFSYHEIARIVDDRVGTIQARVARAMPVLRRCLDNKAQTP